MLRRIARTSRSSAKSSEKERGWEGKKKVKKKAQVDAYVCSVCWADQLQRSGLNQGLKIELSTKQSYIERKRKREREREREGEMEREEKDRQRSAFYTLAHAPRIRMATLGGA